LIFAYGREQRALVLNPFDDIDRPEVAYTVPEILEPAKFKQLLATAEEEVPELIPFLAMAGFAGLRRSELVREYAEDQVLRWEDINWQKQLITVRHEVAKQTSRKMGNRRFIPMEAVGLGCPGSAAGATRRATAKPPTFVPSSTPSFTSCGRAASGECCHANFHPVARSTITFRPGKTPGCGSISA